MTNVREAYTRWSETYDTDRNLTRDLDHTATRAVFQDQRVGTLLELGCGTGKNTAFYASLAERIHALDFSEGMRAQARAKGFGAHVTFEQADLEQPWPVASATVDLAVANLVLEHIADLTFVFGEAARVLRSGGRLFVCELHPFKQYSGSKARFEHDDGRIEPSAYVHHMGEFWNAATSAGLRLVDLREWWHVEDEATPPRLLSTLWERP